jgi:hypothetical protein
MSLPWELRRRGLKDSLRHDQRVKKAIKQNLRDLISEEAIITSDGNKRVKIPLRYLDQYRFKYGQPQQGVGQGEGQPGDVIGRQPGQGDGSQPGDGQPGDQPDSIDSIAAAPPAHNSRADSRPKCRTTSGSRVSVTYVKCAVVQPVSPWPTRSRSRTQPERPASCNR